MRRNQRRLPALLLFTLWLPVATANAVVSALCHAEFHSAELAASRPHARMGMDGDTHAGASHDCGRAISSKVCPGTSLLVVDAAPPHAPPMPVTHTLRVRMANDVPTSARSVTLTLDTPPPRSPGP